MIYCVFNECWNVLEFPLNVHASCPFTCKFSKHFHWWFTSASERVKCVFIYSHLWLASCWFCILLFRDEVEIERNHQLEISLAAAVLDHNSLMRLFTCNLMPRTLHFHKHTAEDFYQNFKVVNGVTWWNRIVVINKI